MQILFVVDYYKPFWGSGGIARICYDISTKLVAMGHSITVFTNGERRGIKLEQQLNRPVSVDGVTVYYFKNACRFLVVKLNIDSLYLLPIVTGRKLKEFNIVHIHSFRSMMVVPIWYYARKYRIPYILQAHGSIGTHSQKTFLKNLFDRLWGKRILKDAASVIASTETEADEYRDMGVTNGKIEVVHGGINTEDFKSLPSRGIFRKAYSIPQDCKMILYLGRIQEIKGLDLLVRTLALLKEEFQNVKLVIAGPDDGYLSTLKQVIAGLNIQEEIVITGFISSEMKLPAYVDADVYVLPSVYECFPTTVMEASACGTPVIITETCNIAPLIKDIAGRVVPYDTEKLKDAILEILTDDKLRERFSWQGRTLIEDKLNMAEYARRVEKIYDKVLVQNKI